MVPSSSEARVQSKLSPFAKEWNPSVEQGSKEERSLFFTFSNGHPLRRCQIRRLRQRILNTPPQAERRIGIDVELGAKKLKKRLRYTLGEDISNLRRGCCGRKILRSRRRCVNQRSSALVRARARYSNSQLERETVGCFLALQETKLSLR
ncbi:hypothetical protein CK203_062110 [Vitis vinifera]|uniref:Uncharacterized protein n=1 Tax=Vitis vinifera TaxID=29760 RepID=A0A438FQY0_VITVI|nr:hypothetical protein CK203_062110 [Vitis vinifera]